MMITRRDAVASFALFAELVASGQLADAQTPAAPATPRPPVFKHDLPNLTLDDWEVTVSYDAFISKNEEILLDALRQPCS